MKYYNREYAAWKNMMERCYKKWHPRYTKYGARGILVDKKWHSFKNFFGQLGKCPDGFVLTRKDRNKSYGPDNCFWATRIENMKTRQKAFLFLHNGVEKSIAELASEFQINLACLRKRLIKQKWSLERAVSTPSRGCPLPKVVMYRNQVYTISQLAEIAGVKYETIRWRLRHGWTINEAIKPANST